MIRFRIYIAVLMSVLMSQIPYIAVAEAMPGMIPTSVLIEEMSMNETRSKVRTFLNRQDFQSELVKRGVSPDEVQARVAALSDQEVRHLAAQMDRAQYGGDVGGILIVVVLVLLIIFLAKRI